MHQHLFFFSWFGWVGWGSWVEGRFLVSFFLMMPAMDGTAWEWVGGKGLEKRDTHAYERVSLRRFVTALLRQ